MFEKNMRYAFLLDAYGEVLDDHAKAIMTAYYEDDLSLAEIAEGEGISRQGVRHVIKKSEEQLDFLESKLGLAEHYSVIDEISLELSNISARLAATADASIAEYADKINDLLRKIKQ